MQPISRRDFLRLSGLAAAAAASAGWATRIQAQQGVGPVTPALHVLSRLTWGVMPADVARIEALGIPGYIDWQLAPEQIPDPIVERWLSKFPFLSQGGQAVERAAQRDDYVYTLAPWQRIYRAVYSERQLFERMVEFWTDHFNVPMPDGMGLKITDDRDVARTHALGRFRDLLFASARSPAMLFYLNNAESVAEHPNENYAREVMELHTLGVDGGYTEDDVKAVARALTGWTVRSGPNDTQQYYFDSSVHDTGEKIVLGQVLPAGRGIEDGLQVLDILATHPSTARFIARKLVQKFVSDQPPAGLVESAAAVFLGTDGDLRQVLRHILLSAEFMAAPYQKFRRPIDFLVAMLRALRPGLSFGDRHWLVWMLEDLGQLPYHWHPPNGYPEPAGAWMNTNGLLNRWNLALTFPFASEGWFEDVALDLNAVVPPAANAEGLLNAAAAAMLGSADRLGPADREALLRFVTDGANPTLPLAPEVRADKLPTLIGLLIASPQFQWM